MGDVNAEVGKQAGVGSQVDGGNQQAVADATSTGLRREHDKGTTEHPAGAGKVAGGNVLANGGTGDLKPANAHGRVDADGESELVAEVFKFGDASLSAMTKAEATSL